MSDITNPYRPGEPVLDPAMLFGRRDAADWIELQINSKARTLVLSGLPLIGKTSFLRHVGTLLQNLSAYHLIVSLAAAVAEGENAEKDEPAGKPTLDSVLAQVVGQLVSQLTPSDLISKPPSLSHLQTASVLRSLLAGAGQRAAPQRLMLYIDDLHLLFTEDMALAASFLTTLMPLLDECPNLHLILTLNQDRLKQIQHPLVDSGPTFNLGPLSPDASLNMVTLPVKNILRFDYGVTKRIVEVNSHHPYYLSLFCHTLLNRQVHDGWVNQRNFDSALTEILDSPIEPFTQIWDKSSWVERAVLAGMAAIQGTHGPLTHQEIARFLQRQHNGVTEPVVGKALKSLAKRGVLVPMGAISYRFHVELLRLWLRDHVNMAEVVNEVDWERLAAQAKSELKRNQASMPAVASRSRRSRREKTLRRKNWIWAGLILLLVVLCLGAAGTVLAAQLLGLSWPFSSESAAITPTVVSDTEAGAVAAAGPTDPAATAAPPEPTPTVTPTPPVVVARTLPSITFMGRDIDQAWRIYVMNADGSEVTPLSPEGVDDTAPTWSPDGQRIAFVSQRDGNREIYIMDATGENVVNLTRHPADDWTPSWSPDGSQLAFSSIRTGGWEIYVLDTACLSNPETCPDSLTQVTADDNANILPVWSPDGSRFVFNSKASGNWDIYTMAIDGSDVRQITTHPENDLAATWSPDGSQFAFETNRDGNVEVYAIDANGSGPARNVTNLSLANDHGPVWSPDGQQLLFYSNREGNWDIFSTTLDGEGVVNLTQTASRDEQTPAWRP